MFADGHEDTRIVDRPDVGLDAGVQVGESGPRVDERGEIGEGPSRACALVVSAGGCLDVEAGSVCPTVVVLVPRLGRPGRVIELSELVPAPDDRQATPSHDHGMGEPERVKAEGLRLGVASLLGRLHPDQARGAA